MEAIPLCLLLNKPHLFNFIYMGPCKHVYSNNLIATTYMLRVLAYT